MIDKHPSDMTYDELVTAIGDVVPCYAPDGGGCHAIDSANEKYCDDKGCLLLQVYIAGYDTGRMPR